MVNCEKLMVKNVKSRKKKRPKEKDCSRCTRNGEAYRCFNRLFVFDIDLARELVDDGRDTIELEPEDVKYSINHSEINEMHLEHVDPQYPGIVAHLYFRDPENGEVVHAHRMIDGHHRATVCQRLGRPFYVHVLTKEESIRVLMRSPEGSIPAEYKEFVDPEHEVRN